jgi:hypothetical protein
VCIGDVTTGTYTVTLSVGAPTPALGSLSLGGASGTQTLAIANDG